MKKVLAWSVFLAFNFLSLYSLLWILFLLDGTVNGIILPDMFFERPLLLFAARLLLVSVEAIGWLGFNCLINLAILERLEIASATAKLARYVFLLEFAIVFGIALYFLVAIFSGFGAL